MKKLSILLLLLVLVVSCKNKQYIAGTTTSITKEVRVFDTIVDIKADTASAEALLKCDSNYNVVLDKLSVVMGERVKLEMLLDEKGTMNVVADVLHDTITIHHADTVYSKAETNNIIEYKMSNFQYGCFVGFWVLVVFIILIIALRVFLAIYTRR